MNDISNESDQDLEELGNPNSFISPSKISIEERKSGLQHRQESDGIEIPEDKLDENELFSNLDVPCN